MKPIIIIKEKNKDGKFELTEKELKELIEKAYEQGVEDGKQWITTTPATITKTIPAIGTTNPTYPHDVYGNPIPYCSGETSGRLNPEIKLNGSPVSTGV